MKLFSRRQPEIPERRRSGATQARSAELTDTSSAYAFRRGRTLTGSASSEVRSLSESQADLKSPRVQAHLLAKQRRRLSIVLILVLIAVGGLYVLTSQFTAHAVVRASPDPSLQLEPIYAETIESYLTEHPLERWRIFTNTGRLGAYLQASAPEVKSVDVEGSAGFGKSLFAVTFREPIASWNVGSRQLYVDGNGVPFSRNYFHAPSLLITDQSGITAAPGQSIASNRFMGFVGQIIGLAKQRGYKVTGITIPPGMTRQVEIRLDGVGYPIKFSSDRPAGEGVEDMVRAVQWMSSKQLTPEYVDVRVRGRAFYR